MDAGTRKYIEKEESIRRVEDYFREIGCSPFSWQGSDVIGDLIAAHRRLREMNQLRMDNLRKMAQLLSYLPYRVRNWILNKLP